MSKIIKLSDSTVLDVVGGDGGVVAHPRPEHPEPPVIFVEADPQGNIPEQCPVTFVRPR